MKTETILRWVLDRQLFEEALHAKWLPSPGASLALVLGENATGKSLFRRVVGAYCTGAHDGAEKMEMIGLSMQGRSSGENRIAHLFIYGDEGEQSTGYNSGRTVTTATRTATERTRPHVIFWDEPDVGLSDNYAAGAGQLIAKFALNPAPHTQALFLVTHRRALVEQLLSAKPHVLFLGENPPASLEEWLVRPVVPMPLEDLEERSHALRKKVYQTLEKKGA